MPIFFFKICGFCCWIQKCDHRSKLITIRSLAIFFLPDFLTRSFARPHNLNLKYSSSFYWIYRVLVYYAKPLMIGQMSNCYNSCFYERLVSAYFFKKSVLKIYIYLIDYRAYRYSSYTHNATSQQIFC